MSETWRVNQSINKIFQNWKFHDLEQELKEWEHFIWLHFLKNWPICDQIRDNFWVFDKYFHNQSPPHPMNVYYGSPLHPCWEILNVNCSGIESGRSTVDSLVVTLVRVIRTLLLLGTKWDSGLTVCVPPVKFKHKPCWIFITMVLLDTSKDNLGNGLHYLRDSKILHKDNSFFLTLTLKSCLRFQHWTSLTVILRLVLILWCINRATCSLEKFLPLPVEKSSLYYPGNTEVDRRGLFRRVSSRCHQPSFGQSKC